jgi:hypothetical protein
VLGLPGAAQSIRDTMHACGFERFDSSVLRYQCMVSIQQLGRFWRAHYQAMQSAAMLRALYVFKIVTEYLVHELYLAECVPA